MYTEKFRNDCGVNFVYNRRRFGYERWEVRRIVGELNSHIARWDLKNEQGDAGDRAASCQYCHAVDGGTEKCWQCGETL